MILALLSRTLHGHVQRRHRHGRRRRRPLGPGARRARKGRASAKGPQRSSACQWDMRITMRITSGRSRSGRLLSGWRFNCTRRWRGTPEFPVDEVRRNAPVSVPPHLLLVDDGRAPHLTLERAVENSSAKPFPLCSWRGRARTRDPTGTSSWTAARSYTARARPTTGAIANASPSRRHSRTPVIRPASTTTRSPGRMVSC
jgi:hypothetical protein